MAARLGTFDDLMGEMSSSVDAQMIEVSRALRAVVLEHYEGAVEVVRLGDKAASYGFGEKKMSESHVYVRPAKSHVNLGFWHGARLPDPEGLLEGTGKVLRHVKIKSVAQARSPAVRALIAAALEERRAESLRAFLK